MALMPSPQQGMMEPEQQSGSATRWLGVEMRDFHNVLKIKHKKHKRH